MNKIISIQNPTLALFKNPQITQDAITFISLVVNYATRPLRELEPLTKDDNLCLHVLLTDYLRSEILPELCEGIDADALNKLGRYLLAYPQELIRRIRLEQPLTSGAHNSQLQKIYIELILQLKDKTGTCLKELDYFMHDAFLTTLHPDKLRNLAFIMLHLPSAEIKEMLAYLGENHPKIFTERSPYTGLTFYDQIRIQCQNQDVIDQIIPPAPPGCYRTKLFEKYSENRIGNFQNNELTPDETAFELYTEEEGALYPVVFLIRSAQLWGENQAIKDAAILDLEKIIEAYPDEALKAFYYYRPFPIPILAELFPQPPHWGQADIPRAYKTLLRLINAEKEAEMIKKCMRPEELPFLQCIFQNDRENPQTQALLVAVIAHTLDSLGEVHLYPLVVLLDDTNMKDLFLRIKPEPQALRKLSTLLIQRDPEHYIEMYFETDLCIRDLTSLFLATPQFDKIEVLLKKLIEKAKDSGDDKPKIYAQIKHILQSTTQPFNKLTEEECKAVLENLQDLTFAEMNRFIPDQFKDAFKGHIERLAELLFFQKKFDQLPIHEIDRIMNKKSEFDYSLCDALKKHAQTQGDLKKHIPSIDARIRKIKTETVKKSYPQTLPQYATTKTASSSPTASSAEQPVEISLEAHKKQLKSIREDYRKIEEFPEQKIPLTNLDEFQTKLKAWNDLYKIAKKTTIPETLKKIMIDLDQSLIELDVIKTELLRRQEMYDRLSAYGPIDRDGEAWILQIKIPYVMENIRFNPSETQCHEIEARVKKLNTDYQQALEKHALAEHLYTETIEPLEKLVLNLKLIEIDPDSPKLSAEFHTIQCLFSPKFCIALESEITQFTDLIDAAKSTDELEALNITFSEQFNKIFQLHFSHTLSSNGTYAQADPDAKKEAEALLAILRDPKRSANQKLNESFEHIINLHDIFQRAPADKPFHAPKSPSPPLAISKASEAAPSGVENKHLNAYMLLSHSLTQVEGSDTGKSALKALITALQDKKTDKLSKKIQEIIEKLKENHFVAWKKHLSHLATQAIKPDWFNEALSGYIVLEHAFNEYHGHPITFTQRNIRNKLAHFNGALPKKDAAWQARAIKTYLLPVQQDSPPEETPNTMQFLIYWNHLFTALEILTDLSRKPKLSKGTPEAFQGIDMKEIQAARNLMAHWK